MTHRGILMRKGKTSRSAGGFSAGAARLAAAALSLCLMTSFPAAAAPGAGQVTQEAPGGAGESGGQVTGSGPSSGSAGGGQVTREPGIQGCLRRGTLRWVQAAQGLWALTVRLRRRTLRRARREEQTPDRPGREVLQGEREVSARQGPPVPQRSSRGSQGPFRTRR